MHRVLVAALMAALGLATVTARTQAHEEDESHETIEKVMKVAMKGGLCKKVASGKASDEEKQKLVSFFEKMAKTKPPKGEMKSWKQKTSALVKAAKAVAEGHDAGKKLRQAANCKKCHSVHKPK